MDPTLVSAEPAGLYGWIMANGQIIAFFGQLIYWSACCSCCLAVWQYKRWVNFQLGVGRSGQLRDNLTKDARARRAQPAGSGKLPRSTSSSSSGFCPPPCPLA